MSKPFLWICLVGSESDPESLIRAWTRDPTRAEQLRAGGLDIKPLFDLSEADAVRDTIARAVWRYQMGPGTFDQPLGEMGELVKRMAVDEAENIRRALVGEPQLPQDDPQTDDDVVF